MLLELIINYGLTQSWEIVSRLNFSQRSFPKFQISPDEITALIVAYIDVTSNTLSAASVSQSEKRVFGVAVRDSVISNIKKKIESSAHASNARRLLEADSLLKSSYLEHLGIEIISCGEEQTCETLFSLFDEESMVAVVANDEYLPQLTTPDIISAMQTEEVDEIESQNFQQKQWYIGPLPGANARKAATDSADGDPIVVAVIDSGINFKHAEVKGSTWLNEDENCGNGLDDDGNGYIDDCIGWDFVNNDKEPLDHNGHGTSSGAMIVEHIPAKGMLGICSSCQLMSIRTLDKNLRGSVSSFVLAIDYAIGKGVTISNHSYGGRGTFPMLQLAVQRAGDSGMLVIASAGNNGEDNNTKPFHPASYDFDNVISVAASTPKGRLATFSNYGTKSVDVAAPGVSIYSASSIEGNYVYNDGTSFSAPLVAAIAASLMAQFPSLTIYEIKNCIMDSAKYHGHLNLKTITKGIVDYEIARKRCINLSLTGAKVDIWQNLETDEDKDNMLNPGEETFNFWPMRFIF